MSKNDVRVRILGSDKTVIFETKVKEDLDQIKEESEMQVRISSSRAYEFLASQYNALGLGKGSTTALPPQSAPWGGEAILFLLLPRDRADDTVGDVLEFYNKHIVPRMGRFAPVWYYAEILKSTGALYIGRILELIDKIKKISNK